MQNRLLSVKQVARKLNYHEKTVQQLCRTGTLAARKIGKSWFIPSKSLDCTPKEAA